MTPATLLNPPDLPPPNGYSHVAIVPPGSRLVWISGQVALTADGTLVAPDDWEGQTRTVMGNLGSALTAAGARWTDVVKLTFFLTDTAALATVRAVRDEFIDTGQPPASSLVRVAGLFRPDLLIEVEAVAAVPAA